MIFWQYRAQSKVPTKGPILFSKKLIGSILSNPRLAQELLNYLQPRVRPGALTTHNHHMLAAEDELEQEVHVDLVTLASLK